METNLLGILDNSGEKSTTSYSNGITNHTISNTSVEIQKEDKDEDQNETCFSISKEFIGGKGGGKLVGEKKLCLNIDQKAKTDQSDCEVIELLGSVTTHKCPGTRTSARVIQKMKQDQIRPITPPASDREQRKEDKSVQKTPSQVRANKPTWTNLERNHFFDALNEFGKDFESIGNYINSKLKRKSATDVSFKIKDQVRQHYYQTYHKICKYIKFSDELKKPAQELYALINYGEMRRKLQFVTDKHFLKLRNLVYYGHITVRCKGKNIRIKTPSCKALRRLNQLDDSLEDIRLPSKIEVIVSPASMESFGRVQAIAQNPRVRTTVPLHKKLINFIKTFQYKWRSQEIRLAEEDAKLFPSLYGNTVAELNCQVQDALQERPIPQTSYQDPEMCFLPKPGVIIHRPLLSITEYLSSVNICLTAYEDRMGVKVRGETLSQDRTITKRQRTESGSDKRSPDAKKVKQINSPADEKGDTASGSSNETIMMKEEFIATSEPDSLQPKCESSGDELGDEINDLLSDTDILSKEESVANEISKNEMLIITSSSCSSSCSSSAVTTAAQSSAMFQHVRSKRSGNNTRTPRAALTFKPLVSDDVIRRIRKGWTVSNAADITIGDLYVVLGQDSKLELEYYWCAAPPLIVAGTVLASNDSVETAAVFAQKQIGMPYNPNECDDSHLLKSLSSSPVANKLKHLLLIANLSERMRKRQCSCGHTCERNAVKTRIERDLATKTFVSNKTFSSNCGNIDGNVLFRQPITPVRRPIFSMDPVKQLTTLTRQKLPRQVLVQRLLLPGATNQPYDVLHAKDSENNDSDFKGSDQESQTIKTTIAATQDLSTSAVANTSKSTNDNSNISHPPDTSNFATAEDPSNTFTQKLANEQEENVANNGTHIEPHNAEQFLEFSLSASTFDECSNTSIFNSVSPINLLRDSTSNSRWLEENLNDFSLTSLLGHLDEINGSRDILDPSSNLSVISESSVDYMHKFQEITALMQSQDND